MPTAQELRAQIIKELVQKLTNYLQDLDDQSQPEASSAQVDRAVDKVEAAVRSAIREWHGVDQ